MFSLSVISTSRLNSATAGPTALSAAQCEQLNALAYVRLRMKLRASTGEGDTVGAVRLRLWYWRDGDWWPLRGEGAGAGPPGLTADPTIYGGRAEGIYGAFGLSHSVVAVAESGLATDVQTLYVEPCEALP